MSLTLNEVWPLFNRLIQSPTGTDTDRKVEALNVAQDYLVKRSYELGKRIDEFLSDPTNISNTITTNYITTPTDFLTLHMGWYREGTQFIPFGKMAFITYDDLLWRVGQNFFDSRNNGTPTRFAFKEPRIYFDQYFNNQFRDNETITGATSGATGTVDSVSGTTLTYTSVSGSFQNGEVIEGSTSGTQATISSVAATTMEIAITGGSKQIKISYMKEPTDAVYYDTINIDNISGVFQVGEGIEGGTSNASAIILEVGATYLNIVNRDGTFVDNEVITGDTSGATADQNGALSQLPQVLDWPKKYKYILCECAALMWLNMKGSNNVAAKSNVVDGLIKMLSVLNRGYEEGQWSTDN